MKNKKIFLTAALMMSFVLTACGSKPTQIYNFASGREGGMYYEYSNLLNGFITADEPKMNVMVLATAGTDANLTLISDDIVDFAIVQNNMIQKDIEEGKEIDYSAVSALYIEACQIVVSEDSDISTVADLAGKRVSVGEAESGTLITAEHVLSSEGLTFEDMTTYNLTYADSVQALKDGDLDAFFLVAGTPTSVIKDLCDEADIRFVSLSSDEIASITGNYSGYCEYTIPGGIYTGVDEDTLVLGVKAILIAADDVPADTVEDMLGVLYDHKDDMNALLNSDVLSYEFGSEDLPIELHEGAKTFFDNIR